VRFAGAEAAHGQEDKPVGGARRREIRLGAHEMVGAEVDDSGRRPPDVGRQEAAVHHHRIDVRVDVSPLIRLHALTGDGLEVREQAGSRVAVLPGDGDGPAPFEPRQQLEERAGFGNEHVGGEKPPRGGERPEAGDPVLPVRVVPGVVLPRADRDVEAATPERRGLAVDDDVDTVAPSEPSGEKDDRRDRLRSRIHGRSGKGRSTGVPGRF
jgi:hypothetical protein